MTLHDRLLGSWRMTDWQILRDGEPLEPPLGPAADCTGQLIYTPEGTMSAHLSRTDRTPFADGSLDGGTPDERAAAYGSLISYTGRFTVDEDTATVVHHVAIATLPNWVRTDLVRTAVFDDEDTLTLDTPPMPFGGVPLASFIRWRRLTPGGAR